MELTKDRQEEILRFTQELSRGPGCSGDEAGTGGLATSEPTEVNRLVVAGIGRTTVEMTAHGMVTHSAQSHLGEQCDPSSKAYGRMIALTGQYG